LGETNDDIHIAIPNIVVPQQQRTRSRKRKGWQGCKAVNHGKTFPIKDLSEILRR
jgi:hypothetical protein